MPDLSGLPALDLAIGLSFIFLLLSLLAVAIQELVASVLALRASTLEKAIHHMLAPESGDDATPAAQKLIPTAGAEESPPVPTPPAAPTAPVPLDLRFYAHPLIRPLYKDARLGLPNLSSRYRRPSYVSPRSFALALIDTVAPDAATPATGASGVPSDHDVLKTIRREIVASDLPANVRYSLVTTLDNARGDLDAFRQGLENWFDDTMARVSGWYKRKTQLILLVIAVGVTLLMNVNTFTIANQLWKDPAVRAAVLAQATSAKALEAATDDDAAQDQRQVPGEDDPTPGVSAATDRYNRAAQDVEDVARLGVPIGWEWDDREDPRYVSLVDEPLRNLLGWALTILAISLGAPFWFDTLSRLSRLRGSGKPETPLPASAFGKANERVPTARPPKVEATPGPAAPADAGDETSV